MFSLGHQLVKHYPKSPLTWLAVGAYYLTSGNLDSARKFFSQATALDPSFAPAWFGFAHTFALDGDSDAALSAYATTSRLFPNDCKSYVCTAMMYRMTKHYNVAMASLKIAESICPNDIATLNELGLVLYKTEKYLESLQCFDKALRQCYEIKMRPDSKWIETILVNKAHSLRHVDGGMEEARECLLRAIILNPTVSSTYSALGLVYHVMGQHGKAITYYHQALGLDPHDTVSTTLLDKALQENVSSDAFWNTISNIENVEHAVSQNNSSTETIRPNIPATKPVNPLFHIKPTGSSINSSSQSAISTRVFSKTETIVSASSSTESVDFLRRSTRSTVIERNTESKQ